MPATHTIADPALRGRRFRRVLDALCHDDVERLEYDALDLASGVIDDLRDILEDLRFLAVSRSAQADELDLMIGRCRHRIAEIQAEMKRRELREEPLPRVPHIDLQAHFIATGGCQREEGGAL